MAKAEDKGDDDVAKAEDKGGQRDKAEDKGFNTVGGPGSGFFGGGGLVVVSFIGPAGFDVRQLAARFLSGNDNYRSKNGALGDLAAKAQGAARKRAHVQAQLMEEAQGNSGLHQKKKVAAAKPAAHT